MGIRFYSTTKTFKHSGHRTYCPSIGYRYLIPWKYSDITMAFDRNVLLFIKTNRDHVIYRMRLFFAEICNDARNIWVECGPLLSSREGSHKQSRVHFIGLGVQRLYNYVYFIGRRYLVRWKRCGLSKPFNIYSRTNFYAPIMESQVQKTYLSFFLKSWHIKSWSKLLFLKLCFQIISVYFQLNFNSLI